MFDQDERNVCPFYKRYRKMSVVCEGVTGQSNTEVSFYTEKAKWKYINEYCRSLDNYESCLICQMLKEKYE